MIKTSGSNRVRSLWKNPGIKLFAKPVRRGGWFYNPRKETKALVGGGSSPNDDRRILHLFSLLAISILLGPTCGNGEIEVVPKLVTDRCQVLPARYGSRF